LAKAAATNGENMWERIGTKMNVVLGGPTSGEDMRTKCKEIRSLLAKNCVIGMTLTEYLPPNFQ